MDRWQELLESFNHHNPFPNGAGVVVTELRDDYVAGHLPFTYQVSNRTGFLHGGAYTTLADTLSSAAAHSTGGVYVTTTCAFHYYKAARDQTTFCEAIVTNRSRKTCAVQTKLTLEDGTLVAEGMFSFYKVAD